MCKEIKNAKAIIQLMGGHKKLAKDLGVADSTVYKWTYIRRKGGTNGYIPGTQMDKIKKLAAKRGVALD